MTESDPPAHPSPSFVPATRANHPAERVPPPSRDVLERVRQRDPEALGELYDRYFDLVFGLVFRLLGDRTAAEDAASEVFVKVHRAAHLLDASRDPAPWLMTIATNICRDFWRSGAYKASRRSDDVHDEAVADRLASVASDPEQDAIANQRAAIVQRALDELPEALRTAIVLHDYQGLDHVEVAERTGVQHAAARKRYSRALAALAQRLRGKLP